MPAKKAETTTTAVAVSGGMLSPVMQRDFADRRLSELAAVIIASVRASLQASIVAGRYLIEARTICESQAIDFERYCQHTLGLAVRRTNHLIALAENFDCQPDEARSVLEAIGNAGGAWILMTSEQTVLNDAVADVKAGARLADVTRQLSDKLRERTRNTGSDLMVAVVEEVADSQAQANHLSRKIEELERELSDQQRKVSMLEAANTGLEEKADAAEKDLDRANEQLRDLRGRAINASAAKAPDDKVKMSEARGELKLVEDKIAKARAELAHVQSQMHDVQSIERIIDHFLAELTVDSVEACLDGLPTDGRKRIAAKVGTLATRVTALSRLVK